MIINLIDKLGDWNPQLFREIKGRFKGFNVASAVVISLVGQVVLFLCQLANLPGDKYSLIGEYCRLRPAYEYKTNQLSEQSNNLQRQLDSYLNTQPRLPDKIQELKAEIAQIQTKITESNDYLSKNFCPTDQLDMQMWWREHWGYIFFSLSIIFIFTLLVAGTYLLINNLATEERRGTLNFLRLSPQSETSILIGKILGVPILIYLLVFTAVPLHFIAGHGANIATSHILSFWVVLAGSCIFFYSAALLFGLCCRWLNGFQAWFGSGAVLLFLMLTMQLASSESYSLNSSFAWFRLLSPFDMTRHLFPNIFNNGYNWGFMQKFQFFYLPVGTNIGSVMALHLLNYGLWTYWIWQALKRCFRNPSSTIFSKEQSYLFVACFQFVFWGFALQYREGYCHSACEYESPSNVSCCIYDVNSQIQQSLFWLVFFNLVLLFGLIAILSPHRQTIQDWARYRHQNLSSHQNVWRKSLLLDLILGEKSPSFVAIAINLVIVTVPLLVWILLAPVLNVHNTSNIDWQINHVGRLKTVLGVAMFITLMIIYATIAQRMLLMKTTKRSFWAVGTIGAVIFLPPVILGMLSVDSSKYPTVWLFSTFPWASLEYASTPTIFLAWLGELSVLVLLNLHLIKQVRLAGESATKALLAGR
ncbi:ABC transporter permease subunit [Brasilonema bromeliae]|uniref:ABC transporter permease n=1 Tax=Brasilonema bromeliae SPC951 TaxID=385972 RepID=A0ABX1PD38_9CYAN|nr:ABC transporter permease subunit [Brasilonema bromeliae]NMG21466.1 ABC transporter permease [Brasilonema bromeliae SPC951]